jgi:hypothetical protein
MSGGNGSGLAQISEEESDGFMMTDQALQQQLDARVIADQELERAMLASLQEQNEALERSRFETAASISRLEQEIQSKSDQVRSLQQSNARLREENGRVEQLDRTLRETREDQLRVEQESATRISELEAHLRDYQAYTVQLVEKVRTANDRYLAVEAENAALLQGTDRPVAEFHRERAGMARKIAALETELENERSCRTEDAVEMNKLRDEKNAAEDARLESMERVRLLNVELDSSQTQAGEETARLIERLESQAASFQEEKTQRAALLGNNLTPRLILLHKIQSQNYEPTSDDNLPNATDFLQSCDISLLTNHLLDVSLNIEQAQVFAQNVITADEGNGAHNKLSVLACDLCRRPKFIQNTAGSSGLQINEFPKASRSTSCCSKSVCTDCYLAKIISSLCDDWWDNLSSRHWIRCPMTDCDSLVVLHHRAAVETLIRSLGDKEVDHHMMMYVIFFLLLIISC